MSATHTGSANSRNIVWVIGVGASRGTGAAVARRFAREGFTVAVTGRSAENLQAVADEIKAEGGHAIEAVGDAQDEAGVLEILRRLETIGPVEVGIYNAATRYGRRRCSRRALISRPCGASVASEPSSSDEK